MSAPLSREINAAAEAIYNLDPHFEPGESVDGFPVSPGGYLTWRQALASDLEFAGTGIEPVTKFATDAAKAALDAVAALGATPPEPCCQTADEVRAMIAQAGGPVYLPSYPPDEPEDGYAACIEVAKRDSGDHLCFISGPTAADVQAILDELGDLIERP